MIRVVDDIGGSSGTQPSKTKARAASAAAVLAADFWCEVVAEHAGCAADRCADKDVAAGKFCANCADGRARDAAFEIAIAASGQAERRNDRDEE